MKILLLICASITISSCFPLDIAPPDVSLNDANAWPGPDEMGNFNHAQEEDQVEEEHAIAAGTHLEPLDDQEEPDDRPDNQPNDQDVSSSLDVDHNVKDQQQKNMLIDWSDDHDQAEQPDNQGQAADEQNVDNPIENPNQNADNQNVQLDSQSDEHDLDQQLDE